MAAANSNRDNVPGRPGLKLVAKTAAEVLADPADREQFVELFYKPRILPGAVIRCSTDKLPFSPEAPLDFQPAFVERVAAGERPGTFPEHAAGNYYCLDMSSVFMAAPLVEIETDGPVVIDLCASPGGKSIFAWRALEPRLLIANEVIGKRLPALISNFERCRVRPAAITRKDPEWWAQTAPDGADIVIVDAPCSGQSLPFRGIEAPGAFHPSLVTKNAMRQRRILANAAGLVRPGGHLLYTTCTFSVKENEGAIEWLTEKFADFQAVEVPKLFNYRSALTELAAYRLFPFSGAGTGGFTALLRREGGGRAAPFEFDAVRRFMSPGAGITGK